MSEYCKLINQKQIIRLIQGHKELDHFDYKIAVNWAIELIKHGRVTDNILMLASFSEPIDKYEILPYVSKVLYDLGLEELDYNDAIISKAHFHLINILNDVAIRENLQSLYQLCIDNNYKFDLMGFYNFYYAWDELEEIGLNFYIEKVDLDNIESELKKEAREWIDKYINKDNGE